MGQLAKQITENSSRGFGANSEKNPKEECKAVADYICPSIFDDGLSDAVDYIINYNRNHPA